MKVILPGSYDPVTLGHLDLIERAAKEHSEVFAVIFVNPEKKYLFSEKERLDMLRLAVKHIPSVRVDFYSGRVIDYMRKQGIEKIIKGYRNESDFKYEKVQSEYNLVHGGYETELYKCAPRYENISSTSAREAILRGTDLGELLSEPVIEYIKKIKKQ